MSVLLLDCLKCDWHATGIDLKELMRMLDEHAREKHGVGVHPTSPFYVEDEQPA